MFRCRVVEISASVTYGNCNEMCDADLNIAFAEIKQAALSLSLGNGYTQSLVHI